MGRAALLVLSNVACCVAGALAFAAGIVWCSSESTFASFVLALYIMTFGALIVVFEVWMPQRMRYWLGFYTTWGGKGAFMILVGVLVLVPSRLFFYIAGALIIAIALCMLFFQAVGLCGSSTIAPRWQSLITPRPTRTAPAVQQPPVPAVPVTASPGGPGPIPTQPKAPPAAAAGAPAALPRQERGESRPQGTGQANHPRREPRSSQVSKATTTTAPDAAARYAAR
eukprot:m51a1_g13889 hypothetical protein (226) ;mRNA; f:672117-672862